MAVFFWPRVALRCSGPGLGALEPKRSGRTSCYAFCDSLFYCAPRPCPYVPVPTCLGLHPRAGALSALEAGGWRPFSGAACSYSLSLVWALRGARRQTGRMGLRRKCRRRTQGQSNRPVSPKAHQPLDYYPRAGPHDRRRGPTNRPASPKASQPLVDYPDRGSPTLTLTRTGAGAT